MIELLDTVLVQLFVTTGADVVYMLLLTLLDTVVRVLALGVGKVEQELLPEGMLVVSVVDTFVLHVNAASLSLFRS